MAKGIDIQINRLVDYFNDGLWTGKNVEFNGRAFVNEKDGGKVPEILQPGTDFYQEMLIDTKKDCVSFFTVNNDRDFNSSSSAGVKVSIYFAVNLKQLYPQIPERATEYAYEDVIKMINKSSFVVDKLVTGSDAYDAFELSKKSDDMQPFHLFRFDTSINYSIIS